MSCSVRWFERHQYFVGLRRPNDLELRLSLSCPTLIRHWAPCINDTPSRSSKASDEMPWMSCAVSPNKKHLWAFLGVSLALVFPEIGFHEDICMLGFALWFLPPGKHMNKNAKHSNINDGFNQKNLPKSSGKQTEVCPSNILCGHLHGRLRLGLEIESVEHLNHSSGKLNWSEHWNIFRDDNWMIKLNWISWEA